jgi:hypothetical protein
VQVRSFRFLVARREQDSAVENLKDENRVLREQLKIILRSLAESWLSKFAGESEGISRARR